MFQNFEPIYTHKINFQLTCEKFHINKSTLKHRLYHKWDMELAFVYPTTAPRIRFYYVGIDGKTRYKLGKNIYTTEELITKYAPEYLDLYRRTNPQGIHHFIDRDSNVVKR